MLKNGITVRVDPHRCVSHGKCAAAAPGIYELDQETGIAFLADPDNATVEQIFAGAHACPTQAIIVEQYGHRVYPQILPPMWGDMREQAEAAARGETDDAHTDAAS